MKAGLTTLITALTPLVVLAQQQGPKQPDANPIYRVTVVQRTAKAVNYQYRSGFTTIDFRGTVLLPRAGGEAKVESKRGSTDIDVDLHGLVSPRRYGTEYLTYVLWAITPEGSPHNLGELVSDASDKSHAHITTDLQAFALVVTAEPYSAVRQPSDVVVMENEIRPDTTGIIEPVEAKYELLPRGRYTWPAPESFGTAPVYTPKVSMHEYEALTEIYQARNAIGIAANAGADRIATDTYAKAQSLLNNAQQLHDSKGDYRQVVQLAREAAQTAEDARTIAQKYAQEEKQRLASIEVTRAKADVSDALQEKDRALAEADRARAEAEHARAQAQAAEAARRNAESEAAAAREALAASAAKTEVEVARTSVRQEREDADGPRQREMRASLLDSLNIALPTLDTARGLVATIGDDAFRGSMVREPFTAQVARVASLIAAHPELHVSVEGYSDTAARDAVSRERAESVQRLLLANGAPSAAVSVAGLGDSRPVGPNSTPQGRKDNSRVEIVISGQAIGKLPIWDKTYTLTPAAVDRRQQ